LTAEGERPYRREGVLKAIGGDFTIRRGDEQGIILSSRCSGRKTHEWKHVFFDLKGARDMSGSFTGHCWGLGKPRKRRRKKGKPQLRVNVGQP